MQMRRLRYREQIRGFLRDDSAATAIEYALIASVVSIAIVASALAVGTALEVNFYNKTKEAFE